MNDGVSVSEVCATIRTRMHEALEARRKQQPCALSGDDMAEDIFTLRSRYLVCCSEYYILSCFSCRCFFVVIVLMASVHACTACVCACLGQGEGC